jgi:hypothetical protein
MTHPTAGNGHPIPDFFTQTHLAPRQFHKSLSIWPLVLRDEAQRDTGPAYITLDDAMSRGSLHVDEVGEGGSVPHVRVTNEGPEAVLFLFGEEIRGAKQNRIANATFLVAPHSEAVIDVSCVEAGRWDSRPKTRFESTREVVSSGMRRMMASSVGQSRARGAGFDANQAEVWDNVTTRLRVSGTRSESAAYADYRESRTTDLEDVLGGFRALDGQVGFVAAVGDEVVGLEAIGNPQVFAQQFESLLRSYAIDAIDAAGLKETTRAPAEQMLRFDSPEPFVQALTRARAASRPSLGLGEDLRIEGEGVLGCALADGQLVHVTAFPGAGQ